MYYWLKILLLMFFQTLLLQKLLLKRNSFFYKKRMGKFIFEGFFLFPIMWRIFSLTSIEEVGCKTLNVDLVTVFVVASKVNGTSYRCFIGGFSQVNVHLSKDLFRVHLSNNKFQLVIMHSAENGHAEIGCL